MKNNYKYLIFLGITLFLFASCDDFFEEDLTGKQVILRSPADNAELETGNILFWWDYIDQDNSYHEKYNLIIVSPSFSAINELIIDTTLTLNRFEMDISEGNYQCWIYALNGSSRSDTTIHSFTVLGTEGKLNFSRFMSHNN